MVLAIVEDAADAGHGVTGDAAIGDDLSYTLFYCGPILTGNCAANYFGDELECGGLIGEGFDAEVDLAELARAAGLFAVAVVTIGARGDGFFVGDFGG